MGIATTLKHPDSIRKQLFDYISHTSYTDKQYNQCPDRQDGYCCCL